MEEEVARRQLRYQFLAAIAALYGAETARRARSTLGYDDDRQVWIVPAYGPYWHRRELPPGAFAELVGQLDVEAEGACRLLAIS